MSSIANPNITTAVSATAALDAQSASAITAARQVWR
jgi:hypothetical protein